MEKEELPEGWDKVSRVFAGQPEPGHSDFFTERVMEQLRRPAPRPSPPGRAWWWVPALVPSLALLLMLAVAGHPHVSTQMLLEAGDPQWMEEGI